MKFIETSAKNNFNVGDSFISMTNDIIKNYSTKEMKTDTGTNVKLSKNLQNLNKKDCCKGL